jgi:lysophospholipase L1-like esterase
MSTEVDSGRRTAISARRRTLGSIGAVHWGGRRRGFGALSSLTGLGLVAAGVTVPSGAGAEDADPVRILLVGDSVTQGSSGDWTWRYRLWKHFEAAGVAVDFVGPRDDLYDNVSEAHGSQAYVDPDFDRDHAARWGMNVDVPDVPIATLVERYRPDVVVEMLGVIDLIYGGRTPETVANRIGTFIDEARSADPGVKMVLAEGTQTWFSGVPEFNSQLPDVAEAASAVEPGVVVADTDDGYERFGHTWDQSHPNAVGEAMIAAAVVDALATLDIGPPASRPIAAVPLGPRVAPLLAATPGDGGATLSWTGPPGATAQFVWLRDLTAGDAWHRLPWPVTGSAWSASQLVNGHRYQFRLQPVKGDEAAADDVRSNIVEVLPQRLPAAIPTPRLEPRPRALRVSWQAAARATSYRVAWWPVGNRSAARTRTVTGISTRIGALSARKRYAVSVVARNGTGFGPVSKPAVARPRA